MAERLFAKLTDDELVELVKLIESDHVRLTYALKAYEVRKAAGS